MVCGICTWNNTCFLHDQCYRKRELYMYVVSAYGPTCAFFMFKVKKGSVVCCICTWNNMCFLNVQGCRKKGDVVCCICTWTNMCFLHVQGYRKKGYVVSVHGPTCAFYIFKVIEKREMWCLVSVYMDQHVLSTCSFIWNNHPKRIQITDIYLKSLRNVKSLLQAVNSPIIQCGDFNNTWQIK